MTAEYGTLRFQVIVETEGVIHAKDAPAAYSIPLDTAEELAAAELLIAKFDQGDSQPGDGQLEYIKAWPVGGFLHYVINDVKAQLVISIVPPVDTPPA